MAARREILDGLRFLSIFKLGSTIAGRPWDEVVQGFLKPTMNSIIDIYFGSNVSACRDFLLKQRKGKFNSLILFTVNIKFGG